MSGSSGIAMLRVFGETERRASIQIRPHFAAVGNQEDAEVIGLVGNHADAAVPHGDQEAGRERSAPAAYRWRLVGIARKRDGPELVLALAECAAAYGAGR